MSGRRNNWLEKILLKFAEWQHKHWVASLLLVRLMALWFSFIIAYGGESLRLITTSNNKKQLTWLGVICTVILILFVVIGDISIKFERDRDKKKHDNGAMFILKIVRDATSRLCDSKYNTLVNIIDNINRGIRTSVPEIISNPEKQLIELADQLSNSLCRLLQENKGEKWRQSDVFVSIAYEYPSEEQGKWHWATRERGLSLDDLFKKDTNGRISTMQFCLEKIGNKVFFNSKQDAFQEKHYIPDNDDEYDSNGKLLGSIACFEDTIKKNDVEYIHYVLTISTYDKRFVSIEQSDYEKSEDADIAYNEAVEATSYNMRKNVVCEFQMRAKIELCLLYLLHLKSVKK